MNQSYELNGRDTANFWKLLHLKDHEHLPAKVSIIFVHSVRLSGLFLQRLVDFRIALSYFPLFYICEASCIDLESHEISSLSHESWESGSASAFGGNGGPLSVVRLQLWSLAMRSWLWIWVPSPGPVIWCQIYLAMCLGSEVFVCGFMSCIHMLKDKEKPEDKFSLLAPAMMWRAKGVLRLTARRGLKLNSASWL